VETPLTLAKELIGQSIVPPEPPTQIEALVEELKALHTEDRVSWEPTSPHENRDHSDDAACLRGFFKCLDYDADFFDVLLCGSNRKAADAILPAIKSSCNTLKHDLNLYQEGNVSDPAAGAKALVFYRRNSFPLKPHLTTEEFDFYESMSNFLVCVLRRAGYSVNGDFS